MTAAHLTTFRRENQSNRTIDYLAAGLAPRGECGRTRGASPAAKYSIA
jgi:hypothetical protein